MEKEGSDTERSYWLLTNRGRLQSWIYWAAAVCNNKPGLYHQVSFSTACQRTRSQRINNPRAFDIWAESAKLSVRPSFRHSTRRKGVYVVRMEDARPHYLEHSVYIGPGLQRVQVWVK